MNTPQIDLDAVRQQALAALDAIPEPVMWVLVLAHEAAVQETQVVLTAGNCDGAGIARLLRDAAGMFERSREREHPADGRPA